MQQQMWIGPNWLLVLALIFGSAVLAALGDVLGFMYGKQRVSIFGLRPKYTSRLITALTGGLITVIVLAVMSVLSQDVRTALFSMNYIQQQLTELRSQLTHSEKTAAEAERNAEQARNDLEMTSAALDKLRNDQTILEHERAELEASVQAMRDESEQLRRALQSMKSGSIAVRANVLLAQTVIEPDASADDVASALAGLEQSVRLRVMSMMSEQSMSSMRGISVDFSADDEERVMNYAASSEDRVYVRALCSENVAFGGTVNVRFEFGRSVLIYSDGETIYRHLYDAREPGFDAEETLHIFLREVRNRAIRDGVLPDPVTNSVGTLSGEAFFDAVDEFRRSDAPVILNALASGDISTEGPVIIMIEFQE